MDAVTMILAAFSKRPRMCIHMLMDETGLPKDAALKGASELCREGALKRLEEGAKGEYVYARTTMDASVPMNVGLNSHYLPALLGLSEGEARERVYMLKGMRKRLIEHWHPILDKVIGDYEKGLRAVESLRCGADD